MEDLKEETVNFTTNNIRTDDMLMYFNEKFFPNKRSLGLKGIEDPVTVHNNGSIVLFNKYEEKLSEYIYFTYEEEYIEDHEIVRESYLCQMPLLFNEDIKAYLKSVGK